MTFETTRFRYGFSIPIELPDDYKQAEYKYRLAEVGAKLLNDLYKTKLPATIDFEEERRAEQGLGGGLYEDVIFTFAVTPVEHHLWTIASEYNPLDVYRIPQKPTFKQRLKILFTGKAE